MQDKELATYLIQNSKKLNSDKAYVEVQYQGTAKVVRVFERAVFEMVRTKYFFFKEVVKEDRLVLGFDILIMGTEQPS